MITINEQRYDKLEVISFTYFISESPNKDQGIKLKVRPYYLEADGTTVYDNCNDITIYVESLNALRTEWVKELHLDEIINLQSNILALENFVKFLYENRTKIDSYSHQ